MKSIRMEKRNIRTSFAVCVLALIASVGVAHAAQVTVNYEVMPSGPVFDSNVITGCDTATANAYSGYEFLFWDNQGTISFSSTVTICPGSGSTVATAWYLETGDGACPAAGCFVSTFAFSIDHDEFLTKGTPIALVSPNSPPSPAWRSPSTTVNTSGPESISAASALAFPPHAAEPFRFWQQLGTATKTPIGVVYTATQNSTAYVVAFYGPDPCQSLRNELQSCLDGDGEGGKLNCSGLGKELQECEILNREIP